MSTRPRLHKRRRGLAGRKYARATAPQTALKAVKFENIEKCCSQILFDLIQLIPEEGLTLRKLITLLGKHGLLMVCMVLTLPSLLPIPIPGMSIPQGLAISLIAFGLVTNRAPWLPKRLLDFRMESKSISLILQKGSMLFSRIEKFSYPRLGAFTERGGMRFLNGVLLVVSAMLLMAPFPIPFSNVLPAYGILFLAFGIMQKDGGLVLAGYLMMVLTVVYIALAFFFGVAWILSLFS